VTRGDGTTQWVEGVGMTRGDAKTSQTRDTRGAQREAVVRQVTEALVDKRR
jgi:hypothetical protein